MSINTVVVYDIAERKDFYLWRVRPWNRLFCILEFVFQFLYVPPQFFVTRTQVCLQHNGCYCFMTGHSDFCLSPHNWNVILLTIADVVAAFVEPCTAWRLLDAQAVLILLKSKFWKQNSKHYEKQHSYIYLMKLHC